MYYKTVKKAPRQIHISQLFEDKSIINSNDHGDCMAALIIAIRWEEAGGLKQNRTCSWNESQTNQFHFDYIYICHILIIVSF